jgi:hypothetical protein
VTAQPPADIAILPYDTFAARVAPALRTISSAVGASAVPGALSGTQWQVQAQVDPAKLSGSPAHALQQATQLRNRVQRTLPGQVVFVDNLADNLTTAAGDALYAETLYIMLAVPGALAALGLAYLAALGTAERDRRNLALLRARGARRRDLVWLAALESMLLGIAAGAVGTAVALAAVRLVGSGGGIGIDWHGHRDRDLAIENSLAAMRAGATRLHGTALGIGERVGNAPMDTLLTNLVLLGVRTANLNRLPEYCAAVADACGVSLPPNYPVVGRDAFRTATGVHAAAAFGGVGRRFRSFVRFFGGVRFLFVGLLFLFLVF